MKYFLLLLVSVVLHASVYPSFTYKEAINIEKNFGKEAVNRIFEYNEIVHSYKKDASLKRLEMINTYLNKLTYKDDTLNYKQSDYWATPKEFLTSGTGDCEDYAIAKYFTLVKLGFNPDKLYITIVYAARFKNYHMVLSYFIKDGEAPLILDNINKKILNSTKRNDLIIKTFLNTNGAYTLNNKYKLTKINKDSKKLKNLFKRVRRES